MKFVAKTLYGLESVLEKELLDLGALSVRPLNRAVSFEGSSELLYKANYCLRTALSILIPVAEFSIRTKDDLYRHGLKIMWNRYLDADSTFSVSPVVKSPVFTHSAYPALVLKDSIADFFRNQSGRRPSVNTGDPDVLVNLHISNDKVTVSLDSTVIPLYKRGYRREQPEAPLNEVLAAGILLIAGWDGTSGLLDPMCGSGTIPVEAGLIAGHIPPGKFRKKFGFMRWRDYDAALFDNIRNDSDKLIRSPGVSISASDISPAAIEQSRINISEAGLSDFISLQVADFSEIRRDNRREVIFMNPPYGIRLKPDETEGLYSMIGSTLKHNFTGCTAWIVTSYPDARKKIGLKPAGKHVLFNGALQCDLLKYELYTGSRKPTTSQNAI